VSSTISLPGYDVTVEPGVLDRVGELARRVAPGHRLIVITDTIVGPLYEQRVLGSASGWIADVLRVPAGEPHKTRASWSGLTDQMLDRGCGRDTAIVALGGGVVGDLAGFVAATFMRGIPYVQVPTTLLAMIDASIGGKTGVDTAHGKNLVGAFHPPAAVIVDPTVLRTLPPNELISGAAEAVKHGVIADAAYFDAVGAILPELAKGHVSDALVPLIARSIEIKAAVVRRDVREVGLRKTLNFGHTIGHAIEALSEYRLLHGEAIAIGMTLESRLAEHIGVASAGLADRVRDTLRGGGLPVERPASMTPESIILATRADKKARQGLAEYALPAGLGSMAGESTGWAITVPEETVRAVLS